MKKVLGAVLLAALFFQTACQKSATTAIDKPAMADKVHAEFRRTWEGYVRYAWGHDEIRPISKTPYDWYEKPLLMMPIDCLDALILLGFDQEAQRVKEHIIQTADFDLDINVKTFEITIRLLGGLLSSYQLTGDSRLLDLARDLGDRLLPGFDSPTGMPYVFVNLHTGKTSTPTTNPAEIGTLTLEFGMLSALTRNPTYMQKVKNAVTQLYNRRSKIGLVGDRINVETGQWTSPSSHIGGCIDSYYEYLIKAWRLFGDMDFKTMWEVHAAAINRYLADEVNGRLWYGRVDMNTGTRTTPYYGALDAFFAGTLVLAGDIDRAARLQESGMVMWDLHGLEPELLDYTTNKVVEGQGMYCLRPEISESAFYLYRRTGDKKYLEMGARIFDGLLKHCRTDAGFAEVSDVQTMVLKDRMESFFLSETLKYLYLLFAPESTLDLEKIVFNTEAHPLQIGGKIK